MIYKVEKDNGWLIINDSVRVKYNDDFTMDIDFNDTITDIEAEELARELLLTVLSTEE